MKYVGKLNGVVFAKCPFYRTEYRKSITCEGIPDGTVTMTKFDSEELKNEYLKCNCFNWPNNCYLVKAMKGKYPDES